MMLDWKWYTVYHIRVKKYEILLIININNFYFSQDIWYFIISKNMITVLLVRFFSKFQVRALIDLKNSGFQFSDFVGLFPGKEICHGIHPILQDPIDGNILLEMTGVSFQQTIICISILLGRHGFISPKDEFKPINPIEEQMQKRHT